MSAATGARSGAGGLLADRAYVELRDQIVTLAIPPGAPINEESLERYLNLSLRIWYLVIGRLPHLFERVHEHQELLLAIRDGDAGGARAIAAAHVARFETEIRGVL